MDEQCVNTASSILIVIRITWLLFSFIQANIVSTKFSKISKKTYRVRVAVSFYQLCGAAGGF